VARGGGILIVRKFYFKNTKLGAENPPFGGIYGQNRTLRTMPIFSSVGNLQLTVGILKFETVCWKIATFCLTTFVASQDSHYSCTI